MSETIRSLLDAIERMYRSFILRDLLGFAMPGAIFISSMWCVFTPTQASADRTLQLCLGCIAKRLGGDGAIVKVLVFLGASYIAALILQSLHNGIVDWGYQALKYHTKSSFLWPLAGVVNYMARVHDGFNDHTNISEHPIPSLMTIAALAPDIALKKLRGENALERLREGAAYTERLSVLMLIMSNVAIAAFPLIVFLFRQPDIGLWGLLGIAALLFLYLEYWRLFYARNLRHEFWVEAASNENTLQYKKAA